MPALTQKGQVTIPIKVRKFLHITQGDNVVFEIEEKQVVVRKQEKNINIQKCIGYLKHKSDTNVDNIIEDLRRDSI